MALAHDPGARHRGHAAAARALSARRGDPVLGHPDRPRRDGARPLVRRRRGSALRAHGRATRRRSRRSRCRTWRSCATCSTRSREIKRALDGTRAADRLLGQPVHARLLHDRRPRQRRDFATRAADGVRAARPAATGSSTSTRAPSRAYLNEQIAAGADVVMLFDTWGGLLSAPAYRRVLARVDAAASLRDACRRGVPTIVFTKGGGEWLDDLAGERRVRASGLDWTVDLAAARARRRRPRRVAGQPRSAGAADRPGHRRARGAGGRARGGSRARPRLQPRPRHRAGARRPRTSRSLVETVHANRARCRVLPRRHPRGEQRPKPRQRSDLREGLTNGANASARATYAHGERADAAAHVARRYARGAAIAIALMQRRFSTRPLAARRRVMLARPTRAGGPADLRTKLSTASM